MLHILLEYLDDSGQANFRFLGPGTTEDFKVVRDRIVQMGYEPTTSPLILTKRPNMRVIIIRESDQDTMDRFLDTLGYSEKIFGH